MTGYQEIMTDPSYAGQIVTMTYPHIGNYGINPDDMESSQIHASALVVRELSEITSNWRSTQSLEDWLEQNQIPVLEDIDTRALVKVIRDQGECLGVVGPLEENQDERQQIDALLQQAQGIPSMVGQNLAAQVSTRAQYRRNASGESKFLVVAYDYGIKTNIIRCMNQLGMDVIVVPYNFPAEEALALNPDGVFLSNGPGDPFAVQEALPILRDLVGKKPLFGICLGHQLLSLALGCQTYKLNCGHHGSNHPVMDYHTNKIEITSHNHGFAVDEGKLAAKVRVTHRNLNDQTIEGIDSEELRLYSVQYHPEAAPGPRDAFYLFNRFVELMQASR